MPTHSDGYKLIALVERFWVLPDGSVLILDDWQRRLIIRVLETDEFGMPRFRQSLISVARQNGKSVLGGIFALYGITQMVKGATVIGIASNVEQANVIYDRVAYTINNSRRLSKMFKATGTRGIKALDGSSSYVCKPSKSGALQGIPVNLALVDELHLPNVLWDDIVNGQRAQKVALVIGITTAGDSSSLTLKRLYADADASIADPESKFGVFIFEGIEGAALDDVESIKQANPAIACGRIDISNVLSDNRGQPEHSQRRFLHNLFVEASNPFINPTVWKAATGEAIAERTGLTFGFDVSPGWAFGCVSAAYRRADGTVQTEIVASLVNPTLEQFKKIADALRGSNTAYAMDTVQLNDLYTYLKEKGRDVYSMNQGGYLRATSYFYGAVVQEKLTHADDAVLNSQIPFAKVKNVAGGIKLETGVNTDAIRATMWATYIASTRKDKTPRIYV